MNTKTLAQLLLQELKDLNASNLPNEAALSERLNSRPELRTYLQPPDEAESLQDIYNRLLLSLIRLARRPDEEPVEDVLGELKDALVKGVGPDQLERFSAGLKDVIIQRQINGADAKDASEPSAGEGEGFYLDKICIGELKEIYFNLLNVLDLDLGDDYRKNLTKLRKMVIRSIDTEDLLKVRSDVEYLVMDYARQVYDERTKAEHFASEVAGYLSLLERFLLTSVKHLKRTQNADDEFSQKLENDLKQTVLSMKGVTEIDKLRETVLSKLKAVNSLVRNKRLQDVKRKKEANTELEGFNRQFGTIKEEVKRVHQENRLLLQKLQLDSLTGAYNRNYYETRLAEEFSRFQRYERIYSMLIIDLDHFKSINDDYGHVIGDSCLRELVRNIKLMLRENDAVIRYGGDEFVVLLPETPKVQAAIVAEKIRHAVESTDFTVRGNRIIVTVTVGATQVEPGDDDYKTVFSRADQALYKAKGEGRNKVAVL